MTCVAAGQGREEGAVGELFAQKRAGSWGKAAIWAMLVETAGGARSGGTDGKEEEHGVWYLAEEWVHLMRE